MDKPLTLTQADFDALPVYGFPPPYELVKAWKHQYKDKSGFTLSIRMAKAL